MLGRAGAAVPVGAGRPAIAHSEAGTSAFLRIAVVGPTHPGAGRLATHTMRLARQLADAGHDVTLVSWSPEPAPSLGAVEVQPEAFPRTVRSLARNRPDTWLRTGRRLRGYDTLVIVHTGAAMVPQHLALLRAAGIGGAEGRDAEGPRGVLVCDTVLPTRNSTTARGLVGSLLGRVDGVLVHRHEEAALAARLGAARVYAVPEPDRPLTPAGSGSPRADTGIPTLEGWAQFAPAPDLSAPWAAYLGAIEALAAPQVAAADLGDALVERRPAGMAAWAVAEASRAVSRVLARGRRRVELTRSELPDWVLATDVLDDGWPADEARHEAHRLGLPRTRDSIAAWAALGALAGVIRVADDGRRAAVVVDESGSHSPLGRWARACGFAPVDLGLTTQEAGYDVLEVDAASLDVVARVHPGGCDASDVDQAVAQAAWALRPGGLLVLTLPLGRPGVDDALGPADVRAVVAQAHEHGFVLVGDLDGEVGRRMRAAGKAAQETSARVPGSAYGLVRLTLRRR